ncbi:peroxisomal acyl-coenzyme A oxidase 1-like [Hibiscus syriacus]|uniref:Peroxisomal acyl-coenzyme A oxidase 1-like n=1 Tax=Hibiscus syriacus TaxID=106335 RepID=A0A6A2ZDU9_HIBSY|nr:peroxisomal acyl-coenzyme A oxidase 1-like [Hibiscus syriacus]
MASILNRTLIIPPILSHHALALGSCPKFRVMSPRGIRISVWDHVVDLIRSGSESKAQPSMIDHLKQCGSLLSGMDDGALDSFQHDEQLKKKKKILYVRRRRDVYKTLGPGSEVDSATVLAFGSLFTAPYKGSELYIDIRKAPRGSVIESLIRKIEFLPFVPEIINAGKQFSVQIIKAPFLCAQLRLLDGQFKNHWKATFLGLKQKLDSLKQADSQPVHIFVMTDLPQGNWTGTYLGGLAEDSINFKLYFLREEDSLVTQVAKKLTIAGHGLRFESIVDSIESIELVAKLQKHCSPYILPDILLFIEETICSCGSLGFYGTAGSTIADSIEIMRKFGSCSNQ